MSGPSFFKPGRGAITGLFLLLAGLVGIGWSLLDYIAFEKQNLQTTYAYFNGLFVVDKKIDTSWVKVVNIEFAIQINQDTVTLLEEEPYISESDLQTTLEAYTHPLAKRLIYFDPKNPKRAYFEYSEIVGAGSHAQLFWTWFMYSIMGATGIWLLIRRL